MSEIAPLSPGENGGSQGGETSKGRIIYPSNAELPLLLAQVKDEVIHLPSSKEMPH